MKLAVIVLLVVLKFIEINCHGRLIVPPARSSAWREDQNKFPVNYNDHEMFCGGFDVQWNKNGGKCGICGEEWSKPKQYEKGGALYKGHIVRTFKKGSKIDVTVDLTANHLGYFEFKVCSVDGLTTDATQACLDKNILINESSKSKRYPIDKTVRKVTIPVRLPADLTCNHCVFQWKYNAGNSWGTDPATGKGCLGCGAQEQFYGCADVKITA